MKQDFYLGTSSSNYLGNLIEKYNPNKILIIRGKNSYFASGANKSIYNATKGRNIDLLYFSDFGENPKIDDVYKGLSQISNESIDLIIGIGGGSVLDMAKLIRFLHSYDVDENFSKHIKKRNLIPLICIPTTAGTGSEATHFAVVYKDKIKYSLEHDEVLPNVAIVDPIFTYNISPYITACTGFDALAQAIEAYWNINSTEESDEYAIKAIKLLYSNLDIVVNKPTVISRNFVSEGSYWAGRAINITKTTAPHAFSYPFTTYYGYPHGHAVALTFPFFMKYNFDYSNNNKNFNIDIDKFTAKKNKLFNILKFKNSDDVSIKLKQYLINIGLSLNLPENFDMSLIISNINIDRLKNNPLTLEAKDVNSIIESIF